MAESAQPERYDVAVVGAGIVGLAHAYHFARAGKRVLVVEANDHACGASVRNFGMLWPIGQPAGRLHDVALRSLHHWHEVLADAALWHERCGSLHLARSEEGEAVLREFAARAPDLGYACELLEATDVSRRSSAVEREYVRAALWSASETCVDPRQVVRRLPDWLGRKLGVRFELGCVVTGYERPTLVAGNRRWHAEKLVVCPGDTLGLLYREPLLAAGMKRCKLQMMRSRPMGSWRLGPMLAGELTLGHYRAFEACPSLPALRARFHREHPAYEKYGIHVMLSQNGLGELIAGDSHEYGEAIEPFDSAEIESLILDYLRAFFRVHEYQPVMRWHGTYAKHPSEAWLVLRPEPGVAVVTGLGGAGMTLSFGVAEEVSAAILAEP